MVVVIVTSATTTTMTTVKGNSGVLPERDQMTSRITPGAKLAGDFASIQPVEQS